MNKIRSTTIIAIKHKGKVAVAGDGMVSFENKVMKSGARKVRRLHDGSVVAGFAGAAADALTLFERLEEKLKEYNGQLFRAAVELAKNWRMDKYLRRLEAMLIAADKNVILVVSGTGDVIEPDDSMAAIGSGGGYALAAARALAKHSQLDAEAIAVEAIRLAASICVFTNDNIFVETLG